MLAITLNATSFKAGLLKAQRDIDFAKVVALTRSAKATAEMLSGEARRVFDRPTPFTINAFYTRPATMAQPQAEVGIKDQAPKGTPAAKYLLAQIEGGTRRQKRGERALQRAGMFGNGFLVPAMGIKLNAYGNIPGPTMVRILSDVKASGEQGFTANRTARSTKRNRNYKAERYFVARPGDPDTAHLKPGIWVKRGGRILPALIYISRVTYRPRLDFYGKGRTFAAQRYLEEFRRALAQARARGPGALSGVSLQAA